MSLLLGYLTKLFLNAEVMWHRMRLYD